MLFYCRLLYQWDIKYKYTLPFLCSVTVYLQPISIYNYCLFAVFSRKPSSWFWNVNLIINILSAFGWTWGADIHPYSTLFFRSFSSLCSVKIWGSWSSLCLLAVSHIRVELLPGHPTEQLFCFALIWTHFPISPDMPGQLPAPGCVWGSLERTVWGKMPLVNMIY